MKYYNDLDELRKIDSSKKDDKIRCEQYGISLKTNLLDRFIIALTKPSRLVGVSVMPVSRAILYAIVMFVFLAFVAYGMPAIANIVSFGGFRNLFLNKVPAFTVTDGKLVAEESFQMNIGNIKILMDTSKAEITEGDVDAYGAYVGIGSDTVKMFTYINDGTKNSFYEMYNFPISYMFPDGFNNKQMADMSIMFYFSVVFLILFYAGIMLVQQLVLTGLYMIIAWPLSKIAKIDLKLSDIYILCLYAETLGLVILNLNEALGTLIPYLVVAVAAVIITVIYIRKAFKPYIEIENRE